MAGQKTPRPSKRHLVRWTGTLTVSNGSLSDEQDIIYLSTDFPTQTCCVLGICYMCGQSLSDDLDAGQVVDKFDGEAIRWREYIVNPSFARYPRSHVPPSS